MNHKQISSSPFIECLTKENSLLVKQKKEIFELVGFETRNKYSIETLDGVQVAFAAEEGKGIGALIGRHLLGHWRSFDIIIFDKNRNPLYRAEHPFRFLFSTLHVKRINGELIGTIQQRFSILYKSLDVLDQSGNLLMTSRAPIWKPWTFPFVKNDIEMATIFKKWSGILKEAFTDTDNFSVNFNSTNLKQNERELILAASLLIDLIFFEKKGSN